MEGGGLTIKGRLHGNDNIWHDPGGMYENSSGGGGMAAYLKRCEPPLLKYDVL